MELDQKFDAKKIELGIKQHLSGLDLEKMIFDSQEKTEKIM